MPDAQNDILIRPAVLADVPEMLRLINAAAQYGLMLPRSLAQLYESVREYVVAQDPIHGIVGCCSLSIVGAGVGEIAGLVVDGSMRGKGLGRKLIKGCLEEAKRLGVARVLALTFEQAFFEQMGFEVMDSSKLPEKLWAQSVRCAKLAANHDRHEVAMQRELEGVTPLDRPTQETTAALEYRVPFVARRIGRGKNEER